MNYLKNIHPEKLKIVIESELKYLKELARRGESSPHQLITEYRKLDVILFGSCSSKIEKELLIEFQNELKSIKQEIKI